MENLTRHLVIMDFDHTIVDGDANMHVMNLCSKLPAYPSCGTWVMYMKAIFKAMHKEKINKEKILRYLENIKLTKGMDSLFSYLVKNPNYEVIILSDSNVLYIDHLLRHHGHRDVFTNILSNPAEFDSNGCLNVEMYHEQNSCRSCEKNLCKSLAMKDYIKSRERDNIFFESINYIGDGSNDLCPSLLLGEKDFVFPRMGFSLHYLVTKANKNKIKAQVFSWSTGEEILETLSAKRE